MTAPRPAHTDYADLIARLEAATGPSLALDIEICRAFLPDTMFGSKVESWFNDVTVFGCNTADGYRHLDCLRARAYTTSLDAALSLVPEGWEGNVGVNRPIANIYPKNLVTHGHGVIAHTSPLALCIAALRAKGAAHD